MKESMLFEYDYQILNTLKQMLFVYELNNKS